MTYVVRMRWAINYRMGYLVHKLGSIQKPRFTVVRKISRKKSPPVRTVNTTALINQISLRLILPYSHNKYLKQLQFKIT